MIRIFRWFRRGSASVRWTLLTAVAAVAAIPKVQSPPGWVPVEAWASIFGWTTNNQWWLLLALPLGAVALEAFNSGVRAIERTYLVRNVLERVLEHLRNSWLPDELHDAPDPHHRLTLFKANRRQTRLKIFARSSEIGRDSKTCFCISTKDQDKCEGVAGLAWHLNTLVVVPDDGDPPLPDVSGNHPSAADLNTYASRTWISKAMIRKNRWKARSFAALAIRVDGRRWGVLVLDSQDPAGARWEIIRTRRFTADVLADILKGWQQS